MDRNALRIWHAGTFAFGLQVGVFTNDFATNFVNIEGTACYEEGIIYYSTFRIDCMPYGGVKDSGFGREVIKYAIEEMTEPNVVGNNQQERQR